jgi:hypothetical protein
MDADRERKLLRDIEVLVQQRHLLREACQYVLEDDGLMPRATSACRDHVRSLLATSNALGTKLPVMWTSSEYDPKARA